MLFKEVHLKGIKAGTINLAFRKWKKASIKKGGLLKTSVGLVKIINITPVEENEISEADSIKAGFKNRELLLKSLRQTGTGTLYKIKISYHAEDPRIALREQTVMTDEKFSALKNKLERLDKYSKQGDWTMKILFIIKDHPNKKAAELALLTGYEKEWLKLNIRKLKNEGLTISHTIGYELSPLGKIFILQLRSHA